MAKLLVSIDGVIVKEVLLTKARSSLGRRPYNDIVLDHRAVSGEHAMITLSGDSAAVQDLGSTNGTFVNGRPIRKQALEHDDLIEIGRYRLQFLSEHSASGPASLIPESVFPVSESADSETPLSFISGLDSDFPVDAGDIEPRHPRLRVLSGSIAGREIRLTKPVTTLGKRGVSVAAIKRGPHGFELSHVDGAQAPAVNGVSAADGPIALQNRDQITIGNARIEYTDQ